ncbi:RIP metalloprotease RseP [Shouchella sp. 1P09AA]|uniref:RIP metalloprotease RseP n=1 Tax=unclassified Shouchella TaxID=2893065 RepID=UPI0039A0EF73
MNTLLAFIAIFSVLVFVHEWGHLFFAKRAGILCYEFAIGMGPKLFAFEKNDTIYTVRLLPIGGYVRMAGEEPEQTVIRPGYEVGLVFDNDQKVTEIIINNKSKHPEAHVVQVERIDLVHELFIETMDEESGELVRFEVHEKAMIVQDEMAQMNAPWHRQFGSKSLPARAMAIFAGPLMNFILAYVLLLGLFSIAGFSTNQIDPVEGSPAEQAGLQQGDLIVAVDGVETERWQQMQEAIGERPNQDVVITFERDGAEQDVTLTTSSNYVSEIDEELGVIGVAPLRESGFVPAIGEAATTFVDFATSIFQTLGLILTGEFSLDYISGPVGIYNITDSAVAAGTYQVFFFAALLSVNLGVINLFPIPALDGGRLMFLAYEGIRGKPVSPEKEGAIQFVGFALVMLLMIVVTWNDISKLFS